MSYHEFLPIWKDLIRTGLKEDGWPWDFTTRGLTEGKVKARIIAKSDGIWAAQGLTESLESIAQEISLKKGFKARSLIKDGQSFKSGKVVAEMEGPAHLILGFERPYLNLASYICGIATQTNTLVQIVQKKKNPPRVTPTRKTLPGYRDLAVYGVEAGGGIPHRLSLSSGVLIKENHITSAGGISKAIELARKISPHTCKIEIEVTNEKELKEAIEAQADIVMFDNFSPREVKRAVLIVEASLHRPLIEVSGGITEKTIRSYAIAGVDIISVGSLTHTVRAVDLSLLIE